jgi:hypothetical protein
MRGPGPIPILGALLCWCAGLAIAATPLPKGQISRSDLCAECHKDIYKMWRSSAHSRSMEDPIFLDAYRETDEREGEAVSKICLGCHAPAAGILKDPKLTQKVSWEGVSCDICHVMSAVQVNGQSATMTFDPGPVKRGPIKDAISSRHDVAYSELHTTSEVCAGCHQFVNAEGTPVMTTYSEWQASAAAKAGKNCQACHMGKQKADVVDPRIMRDPDATVNLHEVPGGHSLDQLNKAISVGIKPAHADGKAQLEVSLRNDGAGHSVPTGMPGRRVLLEIRVQTSEGQTFEERRVYDETYTDATGAQITRDSGYFAKGVKLTGDTRLRSGEQRVETFSFPLSASANADITVKLRYEHSPTGDRENRTSITFYSETRAVGPESPSGQ